MEKKRTKIQEDLEKHCKKAEPTGTKAKENYLNKKSELEGELEALGETSEAYDFLPGHMLLIDEPETALHPSAVRAAKSHLYSLAKDAGWQVMLTTHHPAFVDPLEDHTTIVRLHRPEGQVVPSVYRADEVGFDGDEREVLKSLMIFENTIAEMFFGCHVIIVEGDTEYAAFQEIMEQKVDRYFPVSALGCSPTMDGDFLMVRPADLQPFRVTHPALWLMQEWGFIHRITRRRENPHQLPVAEVSVPDPTRPLLIEIRAPSARMPLRLDREYVKNAFPQSLVATA